MKKQKITGRLSETQMCSLVKAYKEHDCLWDVMNENYKNREAREKAYKDICEKLGTPLVQVTDIPQKIKNLRTSYSTELRKIEASIKAGGDVYRPKLAWFSIAHEILSIDSKIDLDPTQNVETESEKEINITKTNENETQKKIKNLEKVAKKITPKITKHSEPQIQGDEFDVYGNYIATCLRNMPREISITARLDLQKTMADVQLRALRQRRSVENPESCGPSTSKMNEDSLDDSLEENFFWTDVKIEEDED